LKGHVMSWASNSKSSEFSGFPNHQENDSPYG
jgi:hypothetical protein